MDQNSLAYFRSFRKSSEKNSYGCMMINLPLLLSDSVRKYAASIPYNYRVHTDYAKEGITNRAHITVSYGFLTEDMDEVARSVYGTKPFTVKLGSSSIFHNDDARVLKLGVESKELHSLHHKVCGLMENVKSYPYYLPHVTIAYLTPRIDDPYYYRAYYTDRFKDIEFDVNEIVYTTSRGEKSLITFDGHIFSGYDQISYQVVKSI